MYRRTVLTVALCVLALDQVTKAWAVARLEPGPPIEVIGTFLQLSFVRNPGAAFSLGTGVTWVFTAVAAAIAVTVVRYAGRITSRVWAVTLGGVLGGALGNLTDRIFRSPGALQGHVVDFIQLPNYPLFNIADSAVVCAAIAIAVLSLRDVRP